MPVVYPDHREVFIGGSWRRSEAAERIEVFSASTEQRIGSVPHATEADVDAAVAAARAAFDDPKGWATCESEERAAGLERLAAALEARGAEAAQRVSAQNGMPISVATRIEGVFPAALFRYYAALARTTPIEQTRPGVFAGPSIVRSEPVGVVAGIVPWNYPQTLSATKLAPALAAGCPVVLKPSPETVLDSLVLAEAVAKADLPPGLVSIVPGGRELGAYLVSHPGVDKVTFTGSTAAGRLVGAACGPLLRPVTLELGGKSAAIVLDDADLDLAKIGEAIFMTCLINNGQTCYLNSRILAPRSRYEEIVELFAAMASACVVGDALDPATQIGPLVSSRQRERVESYIEKGKASGARVAAGGGRPADRHTGWFVSPTVLADVDNSSAVAQEEIFGPVLCVIRYEDDEDAIGLANDSEYGLSGSVWTSDPQRGLRIARRVQTGAIGINGFLPDVTTPFGGRKASGIGYEFGPEGLASYQRLKSILNPPL
jgi:acyl-CoA reductase-like NAD-dependent aldehyde dehydrogenase